MLPFKALLFDLDGTLLDTAPDFISAIQKMLQGRGLMPLADSELRNTVTNGSAGIIEKAFAIDQDDPQFKTLQDEFLSLYFDNIADKTTLFSGLQDVLDTCKNKGIAWGIVTNKPYKYTQAVLEQLNLSIQSATTFAQIMSRNQSLIQRDCYWPAQNFHYLPLSASILEIIFEIFRPAEVQACEPSCRLGLYR